MALIMSSTLDLAKIPEAILGPNPLTEISLTKSSYSAYDKKPNNDCSSSLIFS